MSASVPVSAHPLRRVALFAEMDDADMPSAAEGSELTLEPGEYVIREGEPADSFFVVLEGEIRVTQRADGSDVAVITWRAGTFFGEVPLLLDSPYLVSGQAVGRCTLYRMTAGAFWRLLSTCPHITMEVLRTMARRVEALQRFTQDRQRLIALGTLSAGLAHELNNPAAAGRRAAAQLRDALGDMRAAAIALPEAGARAEDLRTAESLSRGGADAGAADPLARSDLEDDVAEWLARRARLDDESRNRAAPALAAAGVRPADLDALAAAVAPSALAAALLWAAGSLAADALIGEVEQSAARVSALVDAVRSYSYMDRSSRQLVDLHAGLDDTLSILAHRLSEGVTLERDYDARIPRMEVYGSELNQVWTNLITNALDALGGAGRLRVRTALDVGAAIVEVADDGPGIPADVLGRIFEPFFTTKSLGHGTGLGLVIAARIVRSLHGGDIRCESRPGETVFTVRLPLATRDA